MHGAESNIIQLFVRPDAAGKLRAAGAEEALGGGQASVSAVFVEVAPEEPAPAPLRASRGGDGGAAAAAAASRERSAAAKGAIVPARPALEIQLPYKFYRVRC